MQYSLIVGSIFACERGGFLPLFYQLNTCDSIYVVRNVGSQVDVHSVLHLRYGLDGGYTACGPIEVDSREISGSKMRKESIVKETD